MMTRYRIGAVGGPVVAHLVHRLSAAQPDAQISTHASYYISELAGMVLAGKLDYAQVGVCGDALPSAEYGLVWQTIGMDAVCVLLPEDHPQSKNVSVDLAELADEQWVAGAGDGCFGDCFAAACARAGFAPRRVLESDVRNCVDMVELGLAIGLCQPTFRPPAGLVSRPLRGAPLRWRLVLGWHPESPASRGASKLMDHAQEVYQEILARNEPYMEWMRTDQIGGSSHLAAA